MKISLLSCFYLLCVLSLVNTTSAQDNDVIGFLEPYKSIELSFPESGVIGSIHVKEGNSVKKGQRLASLDNRVLDASIAIAKARSRSTSAITAADIAFIDKQNRLQKLERLYTSGNARQDELARAQVEAQIAAEELTLAKERRQISQLELKRIIAERDRRILLSPISGVISRITREEGESISTADGAVIQIVQLNILKLVVHLPASSAANFKAGHKRIIRIAGHDEPVTSAIEYVSPIMDPRSSTVEARLVVDNRTNRFVSGQRGIVGIQ